MLEGSNDLRYRGAGDHVESFFLKATAPDAKRAIWIKATILAQAGAPERAVAEGWAIAFDQREPATAGRHVAVKHTVSFGSARFVADRLAIGWAHGADRLLIEQRGDDIHTAGAIHSDEHAIDWDLVLSGPMRPLELLPYRWMYTAPLPSNKTVTPLPDARARGFVAVNGARWEIAQWHGMQGHNWGRGHGEYGWLHCNAFDEPDLVVEAVSARLRLGGIVTPLLTSVVVRHRGRDVRFSLPHSLWSADAEVRPRSYRFSVAGRAGRIAGLVEAPVENFVGLHYRNPAGPGIACLNSKLASARIVFEPAAVAERHAGPLARGHPAPRAPAVHARSCAAALEIGTSRTDHGVTMYV